MKQESVKRPEQLVNPYIGTLPHLLATTFPEVMLPHSYVNTYPHFSTNRDYYCNEIVDGFPIGFALVMPSCKNSEKPSDFKNKIDHSLEETLPHYNKIELEEKNIIVESTVTKHMVVYRFTNVNRLLIQSKTKLSIQKEDKSLNLFWAGADIYDEPPIEYAHAKFNSDFSIYKQEDNYAILEFENTVIEAKFAISYISNEQAKISYEKEGTNKNFDIIKEEACKIWNKQLSCIEIEGNNTDAQTVFYTALYRSFKRMCDYSEYGKFYSGFDKSVHDGEFFYNSDGLWDTFRCMHPLQILLEPSRQKNIMESYNLMFKQSGYMPSFPGVNGDRPIMIGFHAAAAFADCASKGIELDYETAYAGIRKNAMEESMLPWVCCMKPTELDETYYDKGFFPGLYEDEKETVDGVHSFENRQSVAVTLEHVYDDWCVAQLAKKLGKTSDYEFFMKRAENYKKLFNKEVGFMVPKDKDGNWIKDFDPQWSAGQGGRCYFAENNTWVYTWSVFHDMHGLGELMGGDDKAIEKLDRLFTEGIVKDNKVAMKSEFLHQFPDATGLIGMFTMGNEPAFHIPYLYSYFGAPWKTQKRLRDLLDIWFTNSPTGICGDEDGGAMSSFYVFSAMGFYPVCPGTDEYIIGSPMFDKININLENGKTFEILAKGAGDGLRYFQSVTLNGKKLDKPFFKHSDIKDGGTLVFEMSKYPNKEWGIAKENRPSSMTRG